jgi:ankyrin repeat protein
MVTLDRGNHIPLHSLEHELIQGARIGECTVIARFLAAGGSIRSTEASALHEAVRYRQGEFASALLSADPGCDRRDWLGYTAFDHAIEGDDAEMVQRFLRSSNGALLLRSSDCRSETIPLHAAAGGHAIRMVQYLLETGAPVDEADEAGMTALMVAASRTADSPADAARKAGVINLLTTFGADVNAARLDGSTPIHFACIADDSSTVAQLVEKGAQVDGIANGMTPAFTAVGYGACDALLTLHKYGARANRSHSGETAITFYVKRTPILATEERATRALTTLLQFGYSPFLPNADGEYPEDLAELNPRDRATIAAAAARQSIRAAVRGLPQGALCQ